MIAIPITAEQLRQVAQQCRQSQTQGNWINYLQQEFNCQIQRSPWYLDLSVLDDGYFIAQFNDDQQATLFVLRYS